MFKVLILGSGKIGGAIARLLHYTGENEVMVADRDQAWSTDGLINECSNPCEAIDQGSPVEVPPLEELELFSLDRIDYGAFNCSGGLGTLCETLQDKVAQSLNNKTVRYKGHRHLMAFPIRDLHLGERCEMLKDILEHAVAITYQNGVLIFCTVSGWINSRLVQHSDARKIYRDVFLRMACLPFRLRLPVDFGRFSICMPTKYYLQVDF